MKWRFPLKIGFSWLPGFARETAPIESEPVHVEPQVLETLPPPQAEFEIPPNVFPLFPSAPQFQEPGKTEPGLSLSELEEMFAGTEWSKLTRNSRDGGATAIHACRILDKSISLLENGHKYVDMMMGAVRDVRTTTGQLTSISEDIKLVSNQSRIVSINASIEANRAGAQGRAFQVVALEMTSLSDDVRNLTTSIDSKIAGVEEKINTNREMCEKVSALFNIINKELEEFRRHMMRVENLSVTQIQQLGDIESMIKSKTDHAA